MVPVSPFLATLFTTPQYEKIEGWGFQCQNQENLQIFLYIKKISFCFAVIFLTEMDIECLLPYRLAYIGVTYVTPSYDAFICCVVGLFVWHMTKRPYIHILLEILIYNYWFQMLHRHIYYMNVLIIALISYLRCYQHLELLYFYLQNAHI